MYPIIFNAANEVSVQLFLDERISFLGIADYIKSQLDAFSSNSVTTINDIIELDKQVKAVDYSSLNLL